MLVRSDEEGIELALAEADKARALGDVPVGCVIVHNGQVIARGFNRREVDQDPTAHAEMVAIREAARVLGSWRLLNTVLYVTLEPCLMCAGAIVLSRIPQVVYGCDDPKAGALKSLYSIGSDLRLNHRFEIRPNVCAAKCGARLSQFFAALRLREGNQ